MTALADFRAEGDLEVPPSPRGRPRAAKAPWEPLRLDMLVYGRVLAFDQTIRKAGWGDLINDGGGCRLLACGTCRTRAGEQRGWATTLADALDVSLQVERVVRERADLGPLVVVHEAPPSGGGKLVRPESSALAALGVRMACHRAGVPVVMLSNQPAKYLMTGQRKDVTKRMVGDAVDRFLAEQGSPVLPHNEDERDAVALALLHLSRGAA